MTWTSDTHPEAILIYLAVHGQQWRNLSYLSAKMLRKRHLKSRCSMQGREDLQYADGRTTRFHKSQRKPPLTCAAEGGMGV